MLLPIDITQQSIPTPVCFTANATFATEVTWAYPQRRRNLTAWLISPSFNAVGVSIWLNKNDAVNNTLT